MTPPDEVNARPLLASDGVRLNHPANLDLAYAALAELRGWQREELETQVAANFARLFWPVA
jgi:TatD DNase family protein